MYKGINLNAAQKFWSVKFILINARSRTVPDLNNVNLMCDIFKAGGKCVNEWTVSNFVEHAILKKITATGRAIAHKKQALLFVKCPSRPPGNWNLYPLVILPPTWHLAVKKNAYCCLLPCFNFSHHISTFHHN